MTTTLRWLLNLLQIVAAVLLLGAIALVFAGIVPTLVGAETFTVYSGSMEPAIHVGALVVVRGTKVSALKPGDVVTYRMPTQPDIVVTHRLVRVEKDESGQQFYRTKGDANNTEDLVLVDEGAVLGRVLYSVPYAGYIVDFSKRDAGKLLFIALPAVLLALDFARGRMRRARQPLATVSLSQAHRILPLLQRGQQALDSGYLELAEKAADGVLELDPRNEDGWLLKATSARTPDEQKLRLQAALMVNPKAARVSAMLETLRSAVVTVATPAADASLRNGVSHDEPSRASA